LRRRLLIVAVLAAAVLAAALVAVLRNDDAERPAPLTSLDEVESGIALMEAIDCEGKPLVAPDATGEHRVRGTGFLVGNRVLMGVEHMVPPRPGIVCGYRARLGGRWYHVVDIKVWSEQGEADRRGIDLATVTLDDDAPGHIFAFALETVPVGSRLTLLGHPLGGPLRTSKAVVTRKLADYGKPTLATKQTPEPQGGSSGGPYLNERGEVVSVHSRIVVWANLSPDGTARHGGIDIPRWWGASLHGDLCRAHPDGGIPGCAGESGDEPGKVPVDVTLQPR
jgi:hypothetical protein